MKYFNRNYVRTATFKKNFKCCPTSSYSARGGSLFVRTLLSTGPFVLPKKDRGKPAGYPEYQRSGKEILCRLIKVKLPDGTDEILCTSLLDRQEYASEEFDELYPYRWGEEDAYKLLKARVEVENFSGKTALSVKQDENRTHGQQINRTNALSMTRDILVGVFLKQQFGKAIKAFDDIVAKPREIIRPT